MTVKELISEVRKENWIVRHKKRRTAKENEQQADFVNCVAWNKTAELLSTYTRKGSLIGVHGRVATRNYDKPDGTKVYVTEIIVDEVAFLEKKSENQQQNQGYNQNYNQGYNAESQQNYYQEPEQETVDDWLKDTYNISSDDLPF